MKEHRNRKCAVKNCNSGNEVPLHSLPNPCNEAKYKKWLSLCGNYTLLKLKPSTVLRHKNICEKHFEECYLTKTSGRLQRYAVPTLNLPEPIPPEYITLWLPTAPQNSSTTVTPSAITLEPIWKDTTYNKSYEKPSLIKQVLSKKHVAADDTVVPSEPLLDTFQAEVEEAVSSSKQATEDNETSAPPSSAAPPNSGSSLSTIQGYYYPRKRTKTNRKRKCSVQGCNSGDGVPLHSLPNPKTNKAKFKLWLSLCGNDTLLKLKPSVILRYKNICGKHFKDCYITKTSGKLQKYAVPTLHLPEPIPLESITLPEISSTTVTPSSITLEPIWKDTTYNKSYEKPSKPKQILPEKHDASRIRHKALTGSSKQLGEYKGNSIPTESSDLCITEACKDSYNTVTKQNLRKCAVKVCSNGNDVPSYSFPNTKTNKARFKQWLSLPGNNALLKLKPLVLYKHKSVRGNHFEDKSSELEIHSVPTKNLPEPIPPSSIATVTQNSSTTEALSAITLQAIWNDIKHSTSFEIILEHTECSGSMASTKCSDICFT